MLDQISIEGSTEERHAFLQLMRSKRMLYYLARQVWANKNFLMEGKADSVAKDNLRVQIAEDLVRRRRKRSPLPDPDHNFEDAAKIWILFEHMRDAAAIQAGIASVEAEDFRVAVIERVVDNPDVPFPHGVKVMKNAAGMMVAQTSSMPNDARRR